MAVTVTISKEQYMGQQKVVDATIAFDASYPTGGESLTAANFRMAVLETVEIQPHKGYIFEWDATNKKVKVFFADYTATTSDAPLTEIPNTGVLTALTGVHVVARGY